MIEKIELALELIFLGSAYFIAMSSLAMLLTWILDGRKDTKYWRWFWLGKEY